ncbi:hypothetical protein chiPu_0016243 [Chiloscyllium punctatum]|uniref:Sema domain-containing protein n=1 Tax=Chiloscyllium punctatum TaxID=137246 RepID=A0A401T545_CHIPU|nr:hypothetical protein [Chiloscyllium punctatum]
MKGGSAVYVAILCSTGAYVLGLAKDSVPRKTISHDELQQLTSMKSFSYPSTTFTTFLVNELQNRLYVGATNTIFILNLTSVTQDPFMIKWNVTETEHKACTGKGKAKTKCHNYIRILKAWNETHLFACGTYAFDPQCAYINIFNSVNTSESRVQGMEKGRGKCPFEPKDPFAATLADGVLYAATAIDFQGKDPAVVKNIGWQEKIRTEGSVKWLSVGDMAKQVGKSDLPVHLIVKHFGKGVLLVEKEQVLVSQEELEWSKPITFLMYSL